MKISDYEKKLKQEQYDIPNVLPKIETLAYNKTFNVNTNKHISFFKRPIFKFATIILTIAIIVTVTLLIIKDNSTYPHELKTLEDKKQLAHIVDDTQKYQKIKYNQSFFSCAKDGVSLPVVNDGINSDNSLANSNSETNNQIEDIHEPEIIKYDEKYIYYLFGDTLIIYQLSNNISIYKTIALEGIDYFNSSKILLHDNLCIIYYNCLKERPYTKVLIYDTLNDFTLINEYEISGQYQDARLYENTFYIVTKETIITNHIKAPYYKINNVQKDIPLNEIKYITNTNNLCFTTIATINLETFTYHQSTQLGSTNYNCIYMSHNKLYLASQITNGKRKVAETTIYIYNISNKDTVFFGFITLDGYVIDQYSLDEYNNMLRVASINNQNESGYFNSISIYDLNSQNEDFTINRIGYLNEGLGKPYQTIRSVNFNKEKANVVTYFNYDPLYDIDLSDPKNPKIIGQYEAPGYSSYLYKFNDEFMIGIGYDDNRFPKLSVYQINKETNTYTGFGSDYIFDIEEPLGNQTSYAYQSPRELLFIEIDGIMTFGIPVQSYHSYKNTYTLDYMIFQIDTLDYINPIKLQLRISSIEFKNISNTYKYYSSDPSTWSNELYQNDILMYGVLRTLYINDQFIAVTGKGVIVYDKNFNLLYNTLN